MAATLFSLFENIKSGIHFLGIQVPKWKQPCETKRTTSNRGASATGAGCIPQAAQSNQEANDRPNPTGADCFPQVAQKGKGVDGIRQKQNKPSFYKSFYG